MPPTNVDSLWEKLEKKRLESRLDHSGHPLHSIKTFSVNMTHSS